MCCFVSSALKNTLPTELLRAPNGSWKHMVRHVSHMTREDRGRCSGEWTSPRWFVLIPFDSHSWPFDKPLNVFAYATLRTTRMASSTLTQFPSSEFEFSTSLRPQRPYGLRRTGTTGLGQLDSHTVPQLWIRVQYFSTSAETVRLTKDGDPRT